MHWEMIAGYMDTPDHVERHHLELPRNSGEKHHGHEFYLRLTIAASNWRERLL
jgi:hypothetical protein